MPYKDREARNAYARAWYAKNAEAHGRLVRARAKRYTREIRAFLAEAKSAPCMDCGGTFDRECMDFDHVRGEKLFNVSTSSWWGYSLEKVQEEIAKCELVCANCHRLRTKQRRLAEAD